MEFCCSQQWPVEITPRKSAIAMLLESDRNKAVEFSTGAVARVCRKSPPKFLRRPTEAEADSRKCETVAGGFTSDPSFTSSGGS